MKLKLTELTEKITPLPWATGGLMTRVEVLPPGWNAPMLVADCHGKHAPESEDERVANAAYLVHSANVLPKLVEALEGLIDCQTPPITWAASGCMEKARAALTLAREVEI